MKFRKLLTIFLYLIAMHSLLVGIALIIIPADNLGYFGFEDYQGNFFKVQGGVFHIVLSLVYAIAAKNIDKHQILVVLTIAAKFIATFFLFSFYVIIEQVWVVGVSGAGDMIMGILVWYLWRLYNRSGRKSVC